MPRSTGTYTAPSNSFNPAVEGTEIDEGDWNTTLDDLEAALTESVYTGGLGSTDNQLVRTDGTDTKKVQGTGITVDDSNNVTGVAALTATTVNIGNADTTLSRTGAGDIAVEGNAIYRAGGTDVPITDGGTGASTATAAFNALSPLTTQGDVLYHNGTNNVRLAPGTAGQVLTSGGAGANPSWSSAGAGDVIGAASSVDGEIALFDGTGGKTIKRASTTGLLKAVSGVLSAASAGTDYGDVVGAASSVDGEIALFDGTGGKTIKRASTTGLLKAASGVLSAASAGTDYYAPSGTDVAIADGGTGASTAAAGFRALAEGISSTQGAVLYRDGSQWVALGPGTSGQVLQTGGAAANPAWATVSGTGDVTAASSFGTDNRIIRSDGTGKGVQASGITIDDSANLTGVGTINTYTIGAAASDTAAGIIEIATNAEVNTGSSTTLALTPSNAKAHQAVAKMWNTAADTGTVASTDGYNVSSMTDHGTGDYTTTFTTALANATFSNQAWATAGGSGFLFPWYSGAAGRKATTYLRMGCFYITSLTGSGTARDAAHVDFAVFGDSA